MRARAIPLLGVHGTDEVAKRTLEALGG